MAQPGRLKVTISAQAGRTKSDLRKAKQACLKITLMPFAIWIYGDALIAEYMVDKFIEQK
jgi:hypothetical protein